jgi:uncharacterized protein YjbI with pentapeptide repeats
MAGGPRPFRGDLEPEQEYDGVLFADAAFDEATADRCRFLDCSFGNVSFGGVSLRKCRFTDVAITGARFVGADLGITAGYESLRGATIDSVQLVSLAPLLARHLGITVDD